MVVFCGVGGVEGGIIGYLLVVIFDYSGFKIVIIRDFIGMFLLGWGWGGFG